MPPAVNLSPSVLRNSLPAAARANSSARNSRQPNSEADGSFTIELPDFAQDPLWPSLSNDAALMFFVVDAGSGQRLTTLKLPGDLPSAGFLRVATSYPAEVEFTAQPGQTKR